MRSENALRRSGRWTSFISRKVGQMRREIVAEFGREPSGRKRFLLDSFCSKYGVFLVLARELRRRDIVSVDGDPAGLVDRNFLAWQHSLARDLGLLFGDAPARDDFIEALNHADA